MMDVLKLIAHVLASLFKSRTRLEAEIVVLRHQLMILRRKAVVAQGRCPRRRGRCSHPPLAADSLPGRGDLPAARRPLCRSRTMSHGAMCPAEPSRNLQPSTDPIATSVLTDAKHHGARGRKISYCPRTAVPW
jgi:hypothetical protein